MPIKLQRKMKTKNKTRKKKPTHIHKTVEQLIIWQQQRNFVRIDSVIRLQSLHIRNRHSHGHTNYF